MISGSTSTRTIRDRSASYNRRQPQSLRVFPGISDRFRSRKASRRVSTAPNQHPQAPRLTRRATGTPNQHPQSAGASKRASSSLTGDRRPAGGPNPGQRFWVQNQELQSGGGACECRTSPTQPGRYGMNFEPTSAASISKISPQPPFRHASTEASRNNEH
jgi:hypothetical protein